MRTYRVARLSISLRSLVKLAQIAVPLFASSTLFPAASQADQNLQTLLRADGSFVMNSCGYYSATNSILAINYWSPSLSKDSKVFLHYGFERAESWEPESQTIDWQQIDEVPLRPSDDAADPMWRAQIEKQLHYRSSSAPALSGLNFVIRVENPDGEVYYEKGNSSDLGFFRINWKQNEIACGSEFPAMNPLAITSVSR